MGRHSCCYKQKLRKGLWSPEEDEKLLRHITKQRGIDPVTHKPLSEVENNGEDKSSPTNESQDKELNLLEANNSKTGPNLQEGKSSPVSAQSYQLEGKGSSNSKTISSNTNNSNLMTAAMSNKDFFLERFATSHHEGGSTSNCQPSDLVGHFSLQQLNYSSSNARLATQSIPSLWFTQSSKNFDMNSEFSSCSIPTILPPATNSFLSTSMAFKPSDDPSSLASFQINSSRFWEAGAASNNSNSSSGSSGNGELQSNSSFFENSIFPWGLADCSSTEKEAQNQLIGSQQEEVKWPELIHNPLLMATALQNQNQQSLYNEIKSEAHFLTENSSGMWGQNQQQQQEPFQTSNICPKDIQRLTAAYGHI
ncbi:r2r3-myb transcription factor, putative [Ricinus communis]|uniref:R2r3-myb transcription factor, putative n=1 Tax=Ricinus communis TaxID=3988 RepID=B9RN29_RICCO|nr:r2r3-myb transcription factor, putative [Ricinus communis]